MWFFLAALIVCFTIVVLYRMSIDMRRISLQHRRQMASDQRDYERYMDVRSKENPQPALPDFDGAIHAIQAAIPALDREINDLVVHPPDVGVLTPQQLLALKRVYSAKDYDLFMERARNENRR